MGEAEWLRLSEAERQKRLMELKLKEKMLRQQGRHDDAADLIRQHLKDSEAMKQLIGDEKAEYERRLKERLERKRRRLAEGMTVSQYYTDTLLFCHKVMGVDVSITGDNINSKVLAVDRLCGQNACRWIINLSCINDYTASGAEESLFISPATGLQYCPVSYVYCAFIYIMYFMIFSCRDVRGGG